MEQTMDSEQAPVADDAWTTVTVTPGAGAGVWNGEVMDMDALDEEVARVVESPPGYFYVRCVDPLCATGVVVGRVYLVLARFVAPRSC